MRINVLKHGEKMVTLPGHCKQWNHKDREKILQMMARLMVQRLDGGRRQYDSDRYR